MSSLTIAQLTAAPTRDQIRDKLQQYWREAEIPITDWESGGGMRVLMELTAKAMRDFLANVQPAILGGGFPEPVDSLTSDDWLTLVADQWFGKTRTPASSTQQTVVLTRGAGTGTYTITPGGFWVRNPTNGNRYVAITGGSLAPSSSLTITVQAESPQDTVNGVNYVDAAGTINTLVNPLPGVTCSNAAPNFSAVSTTPSTAVGKGVVTVGGTVPTSPKSYDIQVGTSGPKASATIQTRVNGGAWSASMTMGASYTFPSGPTATFTDDGTDPGNSFIAGEIYSFTSPGTPITTAGHDKETNPALLARCYSNWPDLISTATVKEKRLVWAMRASALVTRARVFPDATLPGVADVIIAGITNPITAAVTPVQTYLDQHDAITEKSVVAAASVTTITPSGHVTVRAINLGYVQAAAVAVWTAYVVGTDIGGIIELMKLEQILMDAGAMDVGAPAGGPLLLNGLAGNIHLGPTAVAGPADLIANMTWHAI